MSMIEKVAAAIQEASNKFSEEMILNSDPPDMPAGGSVEDIWRAMIEAALKE